MRSLAMLPFTKKALANTLSLTFLIALVTQLLACASIASRHQYVRVATPDKETKVYQDNQLMATGDTTLYMTRESKPQIEFETVGTRKKVDLSSSYRWGQSFGGNALLVSYAPVGWIVDYATGAAWEIDSVKSQRKNLGRLDSSSKLLILPPISKDTFQSSDLGKQVEAWLRKKLPQVHIIPFHDSYTKAYELGFDYESSTKDIHPDDFSELLYKTKATHIVFSDYNDKKNELSVQVMSPYLEKNVFSKTFQPEVSKSKVASSDWFLQQSFTWLPNTLSLGFISTNYGSCSFKGSDVRYCASQAKKSPLSFLSAFSLTNILHYRKRKTWNLYLRFYPDITASFNQIDFLKTDDSLPDLNLDWHYISLGYGARLSFIVPGGETFMEFTPVWTMNYLRLYTSNSESTEWIGRWAVAVQFGFNSWLSNYWNLRFFGKIQGQSISPPGIDTVDPGSQFGGTLFNTQVGIAIGYYFHKEKAKLFKYLAK